MDIKIQLELSKFSEQELRDFVRDGILTRFEFLSEVNARKDTELDKMKKSKIGRLFFDENGGFYPKENDDGKA